MNAVLRQFEFDLVDIKIGFFFDFAAESIFRAFAEFDFSAGNSPEIRPFMGADHERFVPGIKDSRADGGNRVLLGLCGLVGVSIESPAGFLKNFLQFAQVLDDQVRFAFAELGEGVITGENGARQDTSMVGGLDIVLHVANEKCFVGMEAILLDDLVNVGGFIPDPSVGFANVRFQTGISGLNVEMVRMNGAQNEGVDAAVPAKFEKASRVRQNGDIILNSVKMSAKPFLKLG